MTTRRTDSVLFNCCTNDEEPDWSRFTCLELDACRIEHRGHSDECCTTCRLSEAQFFTVYGRNAEGYAEAITDVKTRHFAQAIAAHFAGLIGPHARVFDCCQP